MDFPAIAFKKGSGISRTVLKVFISSIMVCSFVSLFYPFFTASPTVEVAEVVDGDTLKVEHEDQIRTVRLKGVDTPETSGYNTPEEFEGVSKRNWQCLEDWGYKAKTFVEQEVGQEVVLEHRKGVLTVERGDFGRLLGDIRLESNSSLSRLLVEKGFARSYEDSYLELERKARNNSRGLWGECVE